MAQLQFNIKYLGIDILEKKIITPEKLVDGKATFTFNFLVDYKLREEDKVSLVLTEINIRNDNNIDLASFKIISIFELPDFNTIVTKSDKGKLSIPMELEIILKSAALSTSRGILYSELKGTYLHYTILPLIDIGNIVKEQRKKEEQKQRPITDEDVESFFEGE